jgi:hypothetical protein
MTIGYLGANPVLREMLDDAVRELSRDRSLSLLQASDERGVDELAESADLLVVDLGLDTTVESDAPSSPDGADVGVPAFPERLRPVVAGFERLVQLERNRLERDMHPRRFLLVNSTTVYVDTFVAANLDCSARATHSRVRRATVKLVATSKVQLLRDVRWADRLEGPSRPLELRVGRSATFGDLEDVAGFGPGWWLPDPSGIWTQGPRAVLTVALGDVPAWTRPELELTFDRVGVRRGRPVRIGLAVAGTRVETRDLQGGTHPTRWRVGIPRHALEQRVFDIAVELDGDVEWADENRLGLHLRALRVRTGLVPAPLRARLDEAAELLARVARRSRRALSPRTARRPSRRDASSL